MPMTSLCWSANDNVHSSDGSQIEKVEDFKYLGSYTNSQHDIQCRKAQAWAVVHILDKVWRAPICRLTKLKIFTTTVEPILIYGCDSWSLTQSVENALDDTYTRMLQKTQNVSWRHHMTNQELYGSQQDKSNSGNETPKPLERNHHVTTLSG